MSHSRDPFPILDDFLIPDVDMQRIQDYTAVLAIDIGTTYSGYAFSFINSQEDIHLNRQWGNESGTGTNKTPSAVLTDEELCFVDFGFQAKQMYSENPSKYHLFDSHFKMKLHQHEGSLFNIEVSSRNGKKKVTLIALFKMSLEYLYNHALKELTRSHAGFNEAYVRVVLTVPTMWGDAAIAFMRKAACEVGIDPLRLMVALEPEAASLYCRSLRPRELNIRNPVDIRLPNGSRYIVVDCGGGTVDITIHEVVNENCVREVHCVNGGPWGGGMAFSEFEKQIKDVLGEPFIENYKTRFPAGWYDIDKKFELIKRTYRHTKQIAIELPASLAKAYNKRLWKNISRDINKRKKEGYGFTTDGRLTFLPDISKTFFESAINGITDLIKTLLQNPAIQRPAYLFLVGGFSNCDLLYDKVTETIKNVKASVQVLRPCDADIAVVKGAVIFGHGKTTLQKDSVAKLTYGIGVMLTFDPKKHDKRNKIVIDGEGKCKNIFHTLIKKDDIMHVGNVRTLTMYPPTKLAQVFSVTIFTTPNKHPEYITDAGVIKHTTLNIPVPNNHLPQAQRSVKLNVFYTGAEICFRIQDTSRVDGVSDKIDITPM